MSFMYAVVLYSQSNLMCIHSKEVAIDKDEAIQFIWQFPIVVLEGLIFIVRIYRSAHVTQ
jgi:hypothetical protein